MSATGGDMRYGDYLALDVILGAQHPRSSDPNELLFIVQHQTSELWMKLALHELAEERVDLEDAFRPWRLRHVTTVERIIGFKPGTDGTSGVDYLKRMLDVVLFAELWKVRTDL